MVTKPSQWSLNRHLFVIFKILNLLFNQHFCSSSFSCKELILLWLHHFYYVSYIFCCTVKEIALGFTFKVDTHNSLRKLWVFKEEPARTFTENIWFPMFTRTTDKITGKQCFCSWLVTSNPIEFYDMNLEKFWIFTLIKEEKLGPITSLSPKGSVRTRRNGDLQAIVCDSLKKRLFEQWNRSKFYWETRHSFC